MFPIRDTVKSRSFPFATYGLILLNVLIFLFETSLGPRGFDTFLHVFGMIPANFVPFRLLSVITLFTSLFLHGSWLHLISNMWILAIFGDNVEDRMGSIRFLVFYVLSGLAAGMTHVLAILLFSGAGSFDAQMSTVGASGAIAGVLGAYFLLYPRAKVTTLILVVIIPWFVDIPAVLFLGIWFLMQLAPGLLSLGTFSSIAWWAHVGGFIFGLILINFFALPRRVPKPMYVDVHIVPERDTFEDDQA